MRPPNLPPNVREIPISWWKDKLGVFGVQLERQELQADGSWSEPTLVDVMPNQEFSAGLIFKNERAEGDAQRQIEIQDANNLLKYQQDNWQALVQPSFPQVVGEQQWLPPGEEVPAAEDAAEAPTRTQPAPRRTAPAPRRPAPRPRGELTPEEERELAERRSGRAPGTRPTRPSPARPTRPQPATTERRRTPAVGGRLGVAQGEILNPPLEGNAIYTLWASDLTVRPGKTYRYRMRLFVNNPLFRKPELPQGPPSQQAKKFGKLFLIASDWSGWGKPVKIKPLIDFNVIAAAQTPKPGQASTVVKRFYYGQWREEKFRPRPGEPIGGPKEILIDALGQKRVVDFSTGAYLVHIDFAHLVADNFGTPRREIQVLYFNGGGQADTRRIDQDKKAYEQWKLEHQAVPAAADAN